MKELPKEVLWYGRNEPLPEKTSLKAGKLDLSYQAGNIRNIRLGEYEVVRMIYPALRDQSWATIIPVINEEKIEQKPDGFKILYKSLYSQGSMQFRLEASIRGNSDNTIVFEIQGEALSDFETNRTGFCLLHPIKECKGTSCNTISPDGSSSQFTFPQLISPHQPAKNIKEMSYPIADFGKVHFKFEGDIFEMEDQRNWTDDSYKTYCRPAEKPIPYALKKGDKIHQKITLSVSTDQDIQSTKESDLHLIYDVQKHIPMPHIGIRRNSKVDGLDQRQRDVLGKLKLGFYEVKTNFDGSWKNELVQALAEAKSLKSPLKLVAFFSSNYQQEVELLAATFSNTLNHLYAIEIVMGEAQDDGIIFLESVTQQLRINFPGIKIGAGRQSFFADLNRERISGDLIDFISYSISPQVHAFDNQSLVENLSGQSATVLTAKSFAKDKEIHISPVTFKIQNEKEDEELENEQTKRSMPSSIDPRQMSLFGAGWTLGSIKHLSETGATDLTFFESTGEKGIMMGSRISQYPNEFHADSGAVFPVYYMLKEILKDSKASMLRSISSHPEVFEGIVMTSGGKKTIILANYSPEQINVRVDGIAPNARVKKLDEKSMPRALNEHELYDASPYCAFQFEEPIITFKIRPYGIVFVNE